MKHMSTIIMMLVLTTTVSAHHSDAGLDVDSILAFEGTVTCLLYTSPSPRDTERSRMPSSA